MAEMRKEQAEERAFRQVQVGGLSAKSIELQANQRLMAEFLCEVNGGPPADGWPCPPRGTWVTPPKAPPKASTQYTSGRVWSAKPDD
jgi:hypothetical protein